MSASVSRRDFLKAGAVAGAGLTIAIALPSCAPGAGKPVTTPFKPNAWIRVSTDGRVTVMFAHSEMGQGVYTALPMLIAEELDVPFDAVSIEPAGADKSYYNPLFPSQLTGGSMSVATTWKPLREAGARARAMLVTAAAAAWAADAKECRTENGIVIHTPTRRRLKYGELAERAAALPVPKEVTLKDPGSFKLIGTSVPRRDVQAKVTGTAGFGIDAGPAGTLTAVVARSPVFGGKATSWNSDAAKAVPGVRQVVEISSGIAVIAEGYWAASKGRDALAVVWDDGPAAKVTSEQIRREMQAGLAARGGHVAKKIGSGALVRGGKIITADYETPYLAHACMEPMNATARIDGDKVTVWAPTQYQCGPALGGGVQEVAAGIAKVPPENVTVVTTFLGGGFGRRAMQDFVREAVESAQAAKAPVRVVWSREDDIRHDFYRPPAMGRLSASLGPDGLPTGFTARMVGPSIMISSFGAPKESFDSEMVECVANHPYDIPNVLVDHIQPAFAVPLGFWRSVGASHNGFILESFIDELAWAAGQDPVEFRKALLGKSPRHLGVLELAAEKAGWGSTLPEGRARGVAVVKSFDSHVAEVAEVSLNPDRTIRVHKVTAAVDIGSVVNPEIVKAQVESAIVFGLTAALHGKISIENGRVAESNFHDYPLLRMNEMPEVSVYIVPSSENPTGIGEPGTPPIGPAVANAVYALTKHRLRSLPFGPVPA